VDKYDPYDPEEDGEYPENPRESMSFRNYLLSMVPPEFIRLVELPTRIEISSIDELECMTDEEIQVMDENNRRAEGPRAQIDWEIWYSRAGFDEWERAVFRYKLASTSRDRALSEQPDEQSRRALQAAWRKFDRTGLDRLRAAISKTTAPVEILPSCAGCWSRAECPGTDGFQH
jgi:hypothetical protein